MKNTKIVRFVQSLVLLPMVAVANPTAGIKASVPVSDSVMTTQVALLAKQNIDLTSLVSFNPDVDQQVEIDTKILKMKGDMIDAYFNEHDMPLEGLGQKMAMEAEKNGLDWRLIAAISVRESTGGKFDCNKVTFNAFGWGSCKINFKSNEQAIETVARNLGGNNPKTAQHYDNKTTIQILRAYNPPSIVPRYAQQVMAIMDDMGPAEVTLPGLESNT